MLAAIVSATFLILKLSDIKNFMRPIRVVTIFSLLGITLFSCKKGSNSTPDCFPDTSTVRQISNAQATIKKVEAAFYIVEQGSVDTKLNPCTLPTDFQVNNLQVIISGDVKATLQGGPGPCCTEDFVITKISR
jgi:hypothetical protein